MRLTQHDFQIRISVIDEKLWKITMIENSQMAALRQKHEENWKTIDEIMRQLTESDFKDN